MNTSEAFPNWPGWKTVRLIGRGSFGSVFEIERDVYGHKEKAALKLITIPQSSSDIDELYDSGYDEASITATFKSHLESIVSEYTLMRQMNGAANVVNCDDFQVIPHDDNIGWDIFIRMELLTPLTKALPKQPTDEQVIRIAEDMCRALILCRKHGIIHRDIKPQNIFVSENGDYKLGDFGIAKTIEKTSGGTKIGTYKYMAPEVYNNQPYSFPADIYSLGLVLYWMLNERRSPFMPLPPEPAVATLEDEARAMRFSGTPLPPPAHGSQGLKRIVLKSCAYDPSGRYQSAEEMLSDLKRIEKQTSAGPAHDAPDPDRSDSYDNATVFSMRKSAKNIATPVVSVDSDEKTVGAYSELRTEKSPVKQGQLDPDDDQTISAFYSSASGRRKNKSDVSAEEDLNDQLLHRDAQDPNLSSDVNLSAEELEPPPKPKKRLGAVLLGITAALAAVGAAAYFFWPKQPVDEPVPQEETPVVEEQQVPEPQQTAVAFQPGDSLFFGSYEQDGNLENGKEAVEWIILDAQEDKLLLISRYGLDCKLFEEQGGNTTWAQSSLRAWMNGPFFEELFDQEARNAVLSTTVPADKHPDYNFDQGEATEDRLFLLSVSELNRYAEEDSERICRATTFARLQGSRVSADEICWWFLRTIGDSESSISHVWFNGRIDPDASSSSPMGSIRPAFWIGLPLPDGVSVSEPIDPLPPSSAPTILVQPQNVECINGSQVLFPVVAVDAESYQWFYQKPGETEWSKVKSSYGAFSVYSLTAENRHNGYRFRCEIVNSIGTTYSDEVVLTVR